MKIKLSKYFKKKTIPDYGKKFSSYKNAKNYSESIGEYFDNRFTKFEGPDKIKLIDRFYIASFLPSLIKRKKPVVIDIVGGPNPIYSYIKKATNITTKCFILDTKKLVNIIKNKLPKRLKSNVKYISSLDEINFKNIDIVYFNSSLQYLEHYEQVIKKLTKFQPKYILISYTPFNKRNKNYYSIQYGVPGSVHPIIFFSPEKLIKFMKKMKYNIIFKNKYNVTSKSDDFYYGDLIFTKV